MSAPLRSPRPAAFSTPHPPRGPGCGSRSPRRPAAAAAAPSSTAAARQSGFLGGPHHHRAPPSPATPLNSASSSRPRCRHGTRLVRASADAGAATPQPQAPSQKVLWWRAIKLPIYTVAAVPLMVGAANGFALTGSFLGGRFALFTLASVMVIAWLNLSNDGYDAETTVDENKPESIVNLTGSKGRVVLIANVLLAAGLGLFALLVNGIGDPRVFWLLAGAIGCGYVYQCPPFRLSYKGLGEPLCFVAFGPMATTAFYLAQAPGQALTWTGSLGLWASCVLVGITTTAILFCSHFHQIEGDTAAGKRSPLVRMGTRRAKIEGDAAAGKKRSPLVRMGTRRAKDVLTAGVGAFYGVYAAAVAAGALPPACACAAAVTAPVAAKLVGYVRAHHADVDRIFMGKYFAVRWHAAHGVALAAALALARGSGLG